MVQDNSIGNTLQKNFPGFFVLQLIICVSMVLGQLIASLSGSVPDINTLMFAALLLVTIDGTPRILVVLGRLVLVYTKSNNLIKLVKRLVLRVERRWAHKFWRSCYRLRIKFWYSNFLQELTPLRCYDCVINLIMQVLLLSKT